MFTRVSAFVNLIMLSFIAVILNTIMQSIYPLFDATTTFILKLGIPLGLLFMFIIFFRNLVQGGKSEYKR